MRVPFLVSARWNESKLGALPETGLIIRDDSSNIMTDMNRIWFEKGLVRVPFFTSKQQQPFRSFYDIPWNRSFCLTHKELLPLMRKLVMCQLLLTLIPKPISLALRIGVPRA